MTENTLEGLRINQFGFETVKATGTLTLATQPTAADTMTIGTKVYTWKASGAAADGEINVGADLAAAKLNAVAAINGTDSINDPHPDVSASAFSVNVSTLTARRGGTLANAIALTETFTDAGNVFNAVLLGGTVAGSFARGTAVASTSKIAIEKLDWDDADENIYRPQFANGLLMRNRGHATAVQHGTGFSCSDQPMVWEQLMHWLSMAVTGLPTVEFVSGSPDVYRWTFTRNPITNPQPNAATIQRRFTNGSDVIDQRAAYAMLKDLTLKYAQNEVVKLSLNGFARKFETSTITAALSLPTTELGVSALSTAYVNDSWATVGDTLLAEQVVGWELAIGTGLMPLMTAEGRTSLDFTKHQIDAHNVTLGLKLTCLLDPTSYATESAAAAAGTMRAIRVKVVGSGGRLLTLDGLFQYTKPALFKIGEQDGGDIVDIELEEATDQTNFFSLILEHPTVNSLA
jgi:hypothetical protein